MDIFLKIYPVVSTVVGSGEAFFIIGEPVKSVSSSPVELPIWPVAQLHTFYKLTFFGAAYVGSYTAIHILSCFMFHYNFILTDFLSLTNLMAEWIERLAVWW